MLRTLLRLYPRAFRLEYGREITATFQARRAQAAGFGARAGLWVVTCADVIRSAVGVQLDFLRQDLRHAARTFGRAPGFVATAVIVIGLGIGASAAAFSVTEFTLFRPLALPDPDRVVRLWETRPGYGRMELSAGNARDWRARQTTLTDFGLFQLRAENLTDRGAPVRLEGARVDARWFTVLGVPAAVGRAFTEVDERPNAPQTMVVSHGLWRDRFGSAPDVVGTVVRLDGVPHEIVGVMPASFVLPTPITQYWTPLRFEEDDYLDRNNNFLHAFGRLKPDADVEAARRDLQRIAAQLEQEHPDSNRQAGANVYRLREGYSAASRTLVLALAGAAGCLLLIALVNLVNLLIARLVARRRELAVRTALGAGVERLVRQLMTETMLLASLGGLLGIAIASLAVPLFTRLTPLGLPVPGAPSVDWRVWTFAAMLTIGVACVAGALPAMIGRERLGALRDGDRAGSGGRERVRAGLVAVSIVASVVLLAGGGLLLRAMWRLQSVDPGFRGEAVLAVRTALPMPEYGPADYRTRWLQQVVDDVRAIPGVRQAAYISFLPMVMRGGIWPVVMSGDEVTREEGQVASLRFVTPGFFETLGIPLRQGRDVEVTDTRAREPWVAVVSESFARRYWPDGPAIGRRFTFAFAEREVVGVVADIRVRGLDAESEPQVYLPAGQVNDGSLTFYSPKELVILTAPNRPAILPAVQDVIRRADADLPIASVQWLSDVVAGETAPRAVQLRVLIAFAATALLLAGVGLHGLLAFVVSQRRREIGTRLILGARRGEVIAMVVRRAAGIAGAGILLGLLIATWAGQALSAALVGVPAWDPVTLGTVAVIVAGVALAGSLLPAMRAARIDPVVALRSE